MKVYVVTAGCYSNYHIEEIFTDEDTAKAYANLDSDRDVEEFEVDRIDINTVYAEKRRYCVRYDILCDKITLVTLERWHGIEEGFMKGYTRPMLQFALTAYGYITKEIALRGKESQVLKKIAQDRLAVELDKIGMSRKEYIDEFIKKQEDQMERKPPFSLENVINKELTEKINAMYDRGEKLPDILTVLRMQHEMTKEKKNAKD